MTSLQTIVQGFGKLDNIKYCRHLESKDAPARVKLVDKMLMLPPLFNGEKPEKAKTHYKRFNQYIKFQTKEGNIKDTTKEAIELFEHTLDKKALIWFQQRKADFKDLTTMKNMSLARYNPWRKTKREQLQLWNNLSFDPQKTDIDEQIDLVLTSCCSMLPKVSTRSICSSISLAVGSNNSETCAKCLRYWALENSCFCSNLHNFFDIALSLALSLAFNLSCKSFCIANN